MTPTNELAKRYEKLVYYCAAQFWQTVPSNRDFDFDDVTSYAWEGFLNGLRLYKRNKGAALTTFLQNKIRFNIRDRVREITGHRLRIKGPKTVSTEALRETIEHAWGSDQAPHLDTTEPVDYREPTETPLAQRERWAAALPGLEAKDRLVVKMYYGDGLNMKEIGAALGVSESRISQRLSRSLESLRARSKAVMRETLLPPPQVERTDYPAGRLT